MKFSTDSSLVTKCFAIKQPMDFSEQSPLVTYLLFCLTFSLGWAGDLSVDVSEATTLVLSRVDMRSKPEDCPKLQHLSWSKGDFHQLESAFENKNQAVKKFILNSLCMKVSVLCLVFTLIQEFN
jgi:hypothetical protein